MHNGITLYLIASRNGTYLPFIPSDIVSEIEAESDDRIRRGIGWIERRSNRVIAWMGRALRAAHKYYVKLEDRIDPVERVLKALSDARTITVHYGPPSDDARAAENLRGVLRRHRRKHVGWFGVDFVVTIVVVALTPLLAPIPGPNVFFYFPVLRFLSHYRAIHGCSHGLRSGGISFKCLPALSGLEENLRTRGIDRRTLRATAAELNIRGLEQFLERTT